jgi:hypothetical protein
MIDVGMDPERVEAQFKIQMLMNAMMQSLVDRVLDAAEENFADVMEEEEVDVIIALSFIRAASEIAVFGEIEKEDFMSMCEQIYDTVSLNLSIPAGNA